MTKAGYTVSGSIRNLQKKAIIQKHCSKLMRFSLEDTMDSYNLLGQDLIIHCAHDFSDEIEKSFKINVEGTKSLFNIAKDVGIKRQIFISSYSAHPKANSIYGIVKYELEKYFLEQNQTIVRPGLVIGDGGLCFRYMEKIISTPIMPLLDGGSDPVVVIPIDDFVNAISVMIDKKMSGEYNLFKPVSISMKDFIKLINHVAHHRCFYVNIPLNIALAMIGILSKLRFRLPFNLENIKGLKNNNVCNYESHLDKLIKDTTPLESAIKKVIVAKFS